MNMRTGNSSVPPAPYICDVETPWPQVVKVSGTSIGTGFLIGPYRVLTAKHVVHGSAKIEVEIEGTRYNTIDVTAVEQLDAAVLTLSAEEGGRVPEPLPLCKVPKLPVPYIAWGYTDLGGGEVRRIQGFGRIQARLDSNQLQLFTRAQAPGMSGAPLAVRVKGGGWRIAGLGTARHFPQSFLDDQSLAIGYPIEAIPAAVLEEMGGIALEDCSCDSFSQLDQLVVEKEKLAVRQDELAKMWRITSGNSMLGLLFVSLLGLTSVLTSVVTTALLLGLVGVSWLSLVSAREAQANARQIRFFTSTLALIDPESDDPDLLRNHLLVLARQ